MKRLGLQLPRNQRQRKSRFLGGKAVFLDALIFKVNIAVRTELCTYCI